MSLTDKQMKIMQACLDAYYSTDFVKENGGEITFSNNFSPIGDEGTELFVIVRIISEDFLKLIKKDAYKSYNIERHSKNKLRIHFFLN